MSRLASALHHVIGTPADRRGLLDGRQPGAEPDPDAGAFADGPADAS